MTQRIEFLKMSGSGNDFVMIDNRRGDFPKPLSRWAKKLCDRHEGVGAHGLLLLEKSAKADFRMVYFNADGSRASMCGNGARCMAWFAHHRNAAGTKSVFETDAGLVSAIVEDHVVEITMGEAKDYQTHNVRAAGRIWPVTFLNTGVPHAVVFVPRVDAIDIRNVGRALRVHKVFGPAGANVNFVQRVDRHTLKVRTYERGVEGETLACGTGVTASAVAACLKSSVQAPVRCQTAGGDILQVRFNLHPADPSKPATQLALRGPVRITFKGEIEGKEGRKRNKRE
jgi:diaminopimelate epimerase